MRSLRKIDRGLWYSNHKEVFSSAKKLRESSNRKPRHQRDGSSLTRVRSKERKDNIPEELEALVEIIEEDNICKFHIRF